MGMGLDKEYKISVLIFALITIIFCSSLFTVWNNHGIHDWDQHMFYEEAARTSILQYQQLPLWNPWQCGGNVLLANPQSSFLAIHFPLTLLLGAPIAMKLAIFLYLFIGLVGMWILSKKLGMSRVAAFFPPIILFLSGVYAVRMTVGHTNWYHLAWIPWILYFYIEATKQKKKEKHKNKKYLHITIAAFFLALIFLGGGIHPFIIASLILAIYALFDALKNKSKAPLIAALLILLLWIPFGAVKLVPMMSVYDEMLPLEQTDVQPNSIMQLGSALLSKNTDLSQTWEGVDKEGNPTIWQLHEYFAYIGLLPLLLFIAGIFLWKRWEYIAATITIFFIILSQNLIPQVWTLLQKIPGVFIFHGPSRLTFAALFFLALSCGTVASHFEKKHKNGPYIMAAIALFIIVNLTLTNGLLLKQGFTNQAIQTQWDDNFFTIYPENGEEFSQQYAVLKQNKGLLLCYERFHVVQAAIPKVNTNGQTYDNYNGEVYTDTEQNIPFDFSANKITTKTATAANKITLNQNYISGWSATIDGKRVPVQNENGLITVQQQIPEQSTVTFYFLPKPFIIGAIISLLSLLAACIFCYKEFYKNKFENKF